MLYKFLNWTIFKFWKENWIWIKFWKGDKNSRMKYLKLLFIFLKNLKNSKTMEYSTFQTTHFLKKSFFQNMHSFWIMIWNSKGNNCRKTVFSNLFEILFENLKNFVHQHCRSHQALQYCFLDQPQILCRFGIREKG